MRKLIVQMMVTVDGFVSGPDGEMDWIDNDPVMGEAHMANAQHADMALMGYHLYRAMVGFWPGVAADSKTDPREAAFAKLMNDMPKTVISHQEEILDWSNAELCVAENDAKMVQQVRAMKQTGSGYILLYGGIQTVQTLAELVDEYRLDVCPLALGNGKRLFAKRANFELMDVKPYKSGAMTVTYRPA